MAVALYVTGISTPEVHPEFPPLLGTLISTPTPSASGFDPAAEAAKVNDGMTVNQLHHHAASFWIARGANILQVSRLLGHAKPSITLDVYAQLLPSGFDTLSTMGG
jgi:integrase